jgi:septal ring factor EnvC (AmiA/AmiB activator)
VSGPVGEPPLDALPPDAPATVEDVRAGRRWTIVALAWAVAASAIGVIALVQAGNDDGSKSQTQTTQSVTPKQFEEFQKQTNDRLDAFSRRLDDRASEADLQKLDKRLSQVEDDVSKAEDDAGKQADTVTQLRSDLDDLQQRVDDLESRQKDQATTP